MVVRIAPLILGQMTIIDDIQEFTSIILLNFILELNSSKDFYFPFCGLVRFFPLFRIFHKSKLVFELFRSKMIL